MILHAQPWQHREHHPPASVRTLVDLLLHRAAAAPDLVLFRHLVDGDDHQQQLTLADLSRHARAIAVALADRLPPGARVLLPHPPGFEFAAALLGCMCAGMVGVPVPPPEPGRRGPALRRLLAICRDADVAAVLTVAEVAAVADDLRAALPGVHWFLADDLDLTLADRWSPPPGLDASTVAYLQYTSGSTADPKGVVVDHGNLLHNCAALNDVYALGPASVMVYWVPTYHDLGLVYGVALPLFIGFTAVSLAPAAFLARPIRWLRAIDRWRGTHSVAPNFGYELVVARTRPDERAGLDLSCWRHALNGAEPIRAAAEAAFLAAFVPHGLPADVLSHSYGMSEATAELTSEPPSRRGVFLELDAAALERGRVVPLAARQAAPKDSPEQPVSKDTITRTVAGCGVPTGDTTLLLVDPDTCRPCPPDQVGEVWIRGASVARGYWRAEDATRRTFGGRLDGDGSATDHLRSGDLGFVHDGQLFITGRRKDLIILRGENHYPQDLEWAIQGRHPAIRPSGAVAFGLAGHDTGREGDERLVLVTEVYPDRIGDPEHLFAVLRDAVGEYGLALACAVLCPPGAVPKTSSGKVQRGPTKALFLAGTLPQLARWDLADLAGVTADDDLRDRLHHADLAAREQLLRDYLTRLVAVRIGVPPTSLPDLPLARLGLDSLAGVEIAERLSVQLGHPVERGQLLDGRTIADLARDLAATPAEPPLQPNPAERHAPFPLHGIQQAYWVGRAGGALGGVACHTYHEFDSDDLDLPRLERAWQRLVARHDALRLVFDDAGRQRVLADVLPYTIPVDDLRDLDDLARYARLADLRRHMSHQVLPADRWPLFRIHAHRLGGSRIRLHLGIDLLLADGASLALLMSEWRQLYRHPERDLPPLPPVGFRDCALADRALQGTPPWRDALAWWSARRPALDLAPELPLARRPEDLEGPPRFVRRRAVLEPALWDSLRHESRQRGLGPAIVLCTAFQEVLAAWSARPGFMLNMTTFRRAPIHPRVHELVGDFTTMALLACRPAASFAAAAADLQNQFHEQLDRRIVHGVDVLREWSKAGPIQIPFVFTSMVRSDGGGQWHGAWLGDETHAISTTPHVWLDHQVLECDGQLVCRWDAVDDLFPPGLLDAMFAAFLERLAGLAGEPGAWDRSTPELLPSDQRAVLDAVNATDLPLPSATLPELFAASLAARPHAPALITSERTFSYADLARIAAPLAERLRAHGAAPDTLVAVVMRRGWEQVAAVLAVVLAGAAYLPVDATLPPDRACLLLARGRASLAVTQPDIDATFAWPPGITRLVLEDATDNAASTTDHASTTDLVPDQDAASQHPPLPPFVAGPRDLAYVLFTSGSTGEPKGVMIEHLGAVNTILDINARHRLGPGDRALLLSSLSFDLSVHDIFGMFACGGAVVVPSAAEREDPVRWSGLLARGVTVWNTVPALMQMLVDHARDHAALADAARRLRRVLLSGDWIPLALPDAVRRLCPDAAVISLGGATEASIWSIEHPIDRLDPAWTSVPYGRPLANQRFYVLDEPLRRRPVGLAGELWIGGVGLARGYWDDPERTAAAFVTHPVTGERLYRTGDWGRWWSDGTIEFLGRRDHQVKINGHRVELGEIEACLAAHPAVSGAVVLALGTGLSPGTASAPIAASDNLSSKTSQMSRGPAHSTPAAPVDSLSSETSQMSRGTALPAPAHDLSSETSHPRPPTPRTTPPPIALRARLVAHVAADTPPPGLVADLLVRCRAALPAYMVPAAIYLHARLPLTANGKLDRPALQRLGDLTPAAAPATAAVPTTSGPDALRDLLDLVAREAAAAFELPDIDPRARFGDLGVDSVMALRLRSRLLRVLGCDLPVTLAYDYPSVLDLARHLAGVSAATPIPVAPQVHDSAEPIAIVAMACRLPGGVDTPEALWAVFDGGRDVTEDVPRTRWDAAAIHSSDPSVPGTSYCTRGGFVGDLQRFDAEFFGLAPREARGLDPQQRLLLEVTWETLERAGIPPDSLQGHDVGVYVGLSPYEYPWMEGHALAEILDGHAITGSTASTASGRLAYVLGLTGPAMTVDTACSSSLVTVHLACQALRAGECSMALAGGVSLLQTPQLFIEFSRLGGLAPDGRSKAFGAAADGVGWSEGCGMVLLKRLGDAQRDGDPILALVRGNAVNQDGRSNGLTAPSRRMQEQVIERALAVARCSPGDVDQVEAHGTGTRLGDPIEAQALANVYGRDRQDRGPLWLGSSKSNMGHTLSAAGVAGLMKIALSLQHGRMPPTLYADPPTSHIDWPASGLALLHTAQPWPTHSDRPRRGGISSFGVSGTNAHVILEEAPPRSEASAHHPIDRNAPSLHVSESNTAAHHSSARSDASHFCERNDGDDSTSDLPLLVSGSTDAAVRAQAARWGDWLAAHPDASWTSVRHTAARRRNHFRVRAAIHASDPRAALPVLRALADGRPHPDLLTTSATGRLAVLFTGQGSQRSGMGAGLSDHPVFRDTFARTCAELDRHLDAPLAASLDDAHALEQTRLTQPALFALEVALYRQWEAWGLRPEFLIGHSVGELAAAHVAGALSLVDAARLVCARGRLMQAMPAGGAMASIAASEAELLPHLHSGVAIAGLAGPRQSVVSGDLAAVQALVEQFAALGRRTRRLAVSHAFHSPHMDGMLAELAEVVAACTIRPPRIPIISTLTGRRLDDHALADPAYWTAQARGTVRFLDAVRTAFAAGARVFLECGPDSTLTGMTPGCVPGDAPVVCLASLRRDQPEAHALARARSAVHVAGVALDPRVLGPDGDLLALPTYPWQRLHHWRPPPAPVESGTPARFALGGAFRPLPDGGFLHELHVGPRSQPYLADHRVLGRIVAPGTFHLAVLLALAAERWPEGQVELRDVFFRAPLFLDLERDLLLSAHLQPDGPDAYAVVLATREPDRLAWRTHVEARIARTDDMLPAIPAASGPAELRLGFDDIVGALADVAVEWGPRWAWTAAIERRGALVTTRLARPTDAPGDAHAPVSAVLLDNASAAGMAHRWPAAIEGGAPRLPFALDRLTWSGRPSDIVEARRRLHGDLDAEAESADLSLHTRDGACVLAIAGMRIKRAPRDRFLGAGDDPLFRLELELLQAPPLADPPAQVVLGHALGERLDLPVITDLADLREQPRRILLDLDDPFTDSPETLRAALDRHARTIADWLAAGTPAELVAIATGADLVHGALRGLMRAIRQEHPDRPLRFVHTDHADPITLLRALELDEPELEITGTEIRALRLRKFVAPTQPAPQSLPQSLESASSSSHPSSQSLPLAHPTAFLDLSHASSSLAPSQASSQSLPLAHPAAFLELSHASSSLARSQDSSQSLVPAHLTSSLELSHASSSTGPSQASSQSLASSQASSQSLPLDTSSIDLSHAASSQPSSQSLALADGTVLITGGTGDLGLLLARHLVIAHRVRHLLLVSRHSSAPDPFLADLAALGASVRLVACDVTRAADLEALLTDLPLSGVFHLAGQLADGLFTDTSAERRHAVLAPKIDGAWHLDRVTRRHPLAAFVLFSSAAGLLGSPGQSSYAAANACLDALAERRRAAGLPATSLVWGPWDNLGMAAGLGPADLGRMRRDGLAPLSAARALALLDQALRTDQPVLALLDLDLHTRRERLPAVLRGLVPTLAAARPSSAGLRAQLERLPERERQPFLLDLARTEIAAVLGLSGPERVPIDRPLQELGLDSLMAVDLRNRLGERARIALPATLAFDHPTAGAIARFLLAGLDLSPPTAAPPPAAPSLPLPDDAIAVIGMACRFPGGVDEPDALWSLLAQGRDAITEVPARRFDIDAWYHPDPAHRGTTYARTGGFLGDIDGLDAGFFRIAPVEAKSLDPQGRLLLECTWEALERAGIVPDRLAGSATGVYVGLCGTEYVIDAMADAQAIDAYSLLGTAHSAIVGRLSYWLGLRGPNFPVDTACSSSLVALHLACQGLRAGECDLAIAGGANLLLTPEGFVYFSRLQALSPTGRSRAFSADADGYVRGEGCGVLVLKRLADARRDGDPVLALVRGSAVNQDGRSNGFTAPSGPAQQDVIRRALAGAHLSPASVGYVECHGTGTVLGDPIEAQALAAVYGEGRDPARPVLIGSVKSNIGHTEGAAGVASVIKTVLALQHRQIPASLHVGRPNPHVAWADLPVRIADALQPFPAADGPRRAGVSSFGFSGTNAHVILEEAPEPAPAARLSSSSPERPASSDTQHVPADTSPVAVVPSASPVLSDTKHVPADTSPVSAPSPSPVPSDTKHVPADTSSAPSPSPVPSDTKPVPPDTSSALAAPSPSPVPSDTRPVPSDTRHVPADTSSALAAPSPSPVPSDTKLPADTSLPLLLSGRGLALQAQAARLAAWLRRHPEVSLRDVVHTAAVARTHFSHRAVLRVTDPSNALEALDALAEQRPHPAVRTAVARDLGGPVFVFSGQGGQWSGMGRAMLARSPAFAAVVAACEAAFAGLTDLPLRALLHDAPREALDRPAAIQPLLYTLALGLVAAWRELGVEPVAVVGHSLGEVAAAVTAGALPLAEGARIVAHRGRLLQSLSDPGDIAHVELPEPDLRPRLAAWGDRLCVAGVNHPGATVVAGDAGALAELLADLRAHGVFCRPIAMGYASHSRHVDPILPAFRHALADLRPRPTAIPFYSSVTGALTPGDALGADYWPRSLRQPVRIDRALAALVGDGRDLLLEIGPHPVLAMALHAAVPAHGHVAASLQRGAGDPDELRHALADLHLHGFAVDWSRALADLDAVRVPLPTYPFQRERHWLPPGTARLDLGAAGLARIDHPLVRAGTGLAEHGAHLFTGRLSQAEQPWIADHVLLGVTVFPATGWLELAMAVARALDLDAVLGLALEAPLALPAGAAVHLQIAVDPADVHGQRKLRIHTRRGDDPWICHATGLLGTHSAQSPSPFPWPPPGDPVDLAALYSEIARADVAYGPTFRGLVEAWRHEQRIFARIVAPTGLADVARHVLHPALLDAALHTFALSRVGVDLDTAMLPVAWSDVAVHAAGASDLRVCITLADDAGPDDATLALTIRDGAGRPVLDVGALRFRRAARSRLESAGARPLHHVAWQPVALPDPAPRRAVVLGASALARALDLPIIADLADLPRGDLPSQIILDLTGDHPLDSPLESAHIDSSVESPNLTNSHESQHSPSSRHFKHESHLASSVYSSDESQDPAASSDSSHAPAYHAGAPAYHASAPVHGAAPHPGASQDSRHAPDRPATEHPGESRAQPHAERALAAAQAWLRDPALAACELVCITRAAVAPPVHDPAAAAAWGLLRSVREEHPDRHLRLLDLAPDVLDLALLRRALAHDEPELALRDAQVHVPRLQRLPAGAPRPVSLDPAALVWISGGTGDLAAVLAQHLVVRHGVRHLLLTSRRGPDAPGARDLADDLRRRGASVRLEAVDSADLPALTRLHAALERPLTAVFHLAGVLDDGIVSALTPARLARVLAPKVDGAWHLHRLTRHQPLAAFVLFSSLAGATGGPGQASYAAANAALDALAAHRHALGLPAHSLAWGLWDGLGMGARLGARDLARLRARGLAPIARDQALQWLDDALVRPEPCLVPVQLDLAALRHGTPPLLLRALVPARRPAAPAQLGLTHLAPADRRAHLLDLVRGVIAGVVGAPSESIQPDLLLRDLGLDSLMAVKLRGELGQRVPVPLPVTLAYDYPTPAAIAELLLSHIAEPETTTPTTPTVAAENDPIAIIGLACRLPRGIDDPAAFWQLLRDGGDLIGPFPERWDTDALYDPDPDVPGKTYAREGGFLTDLAGFDAAFFGISPREASAMDPQQRLLLETAWDALEHAGLRPADLRGSSTGVYIGGSHSDYDHDLALETLDGLGGTGTATSVMSGRVAYTLGLCGPAITVDTACSASLVALHLASAAIRNGDCDLALAGGVQALVSPAIFVEFSRLRGLARDGRCKSFAASADGAGWSEGVGLLVLKRLSHARRDGDRVLALVRATASNQDGRSQGMTAPNGPAQQRVIRRALQTAGLAPDAIDYIEAHGTGTALGDPIEAGALADVFGPGRPAARPLLLGSCKSNIGHTQAAAGVLGIIKVVLALGHEQLPRTIHAERPTPHVDWDRSGLALVQQLTPWPRTRRPRRAGVSSFGISGTNAHAILEEAPALDMPQETASSYLSRRPSKSHPSAATGDLSREPSSTRSSADLSRHPSAARISPDLSLDRSATSVSADLSQTPRSFALPEETSHLSREPSSPRPSADLSGEPSSARSSSDLSREPSAAHASAAMSREPSAPQLPLLLSARDDAALRAQAARWAAWLADHPQADWPAVLHTAAVRRTHHARRAALAALDRNHAIALLRELAAGRPDPAITLGDARPRGKLVFVFPGQGSQWPGMGRDLLQQSPAFAAAVDACERALHPHTGWSVTAVLRGDPDAPPLTRVDVVQPALFAMALGLAAAWRELGLVPDAVVGHSQGEIAAAVIAGALTLEDGARVVATRSRLVCGLGRAGAMLVVEHPLADLEPLLRPFGDALALAAVNADDSLILAGDPAAAEALAAELDARGVFCRRVDVDYASHCSAVDPILPDLRRELADLRPATPQLAFCSTVTGAPLTEPPGADYWCRNLRQPVRLDRAVRHLLEADHDIVLELSPRPLLAIPLGRLLAARHGLVLASLRRDEGGLGPLHAALGGLHVHGGRVDWPRLLPGAPVSLPTYAWQREHFWRAEPPPRPTGAHPFLGRAQTTSLRPGCRLWPIEIDLRQQPWLADHRVFAAVLLPGAALVELFLAAGAQLLGDRPVALEGLAFQRPIALDPAAPWSGELVATRHGDTWSLQLTRCPDPDADLPVWIEHTTATIRPAAAEPRHNTSVDPLRSTSDESRSDRDLDLRPGVGPDLAPCDTPVPLDRHHASQRNRGLQLGAAFQTLAELWQGPQAARARLVLAPAQAGAIRSFAAHPALLDAALALVGAAALPTNPGDDALYLLAAIDQVRLHAPLGRELWAHATVVAHPDRLAGTLELRGPDGQPRMTLTGVTLRRLARPVAAGPTPWLAPRWRPAPAPALRPAESGTWLLIGGDEPFHRALAPQLQPHGIDLRPVDLAALDAALALDPPPRAILLAPPAPTRALAPPDPDADDSTRALALPGPAADAPSRALAPPDPAADAPTRALALPGPAADAPSRALAPPDTDSTAPTRAVAPPDPAADAPTRAVAPPETDSAAPTRAAAPPDDLADAAARRGARLLAVVQAIARAGLAPRLYLLTRGAQPVGDLAATGLLDASLWGLGRSLALEHPELACTRIDLAPAPTPDEPELLARELLALAGPDEVALRGRERHLVRLERRPDSDLPQRSGPALRPDATYLITGGLGGLGLLTASWLADAGARHLVLASRRSPDASQLAAIATLRARGLDVELAALDVADEPAVRALLARIAGAMPPLRGVFHLAGVLADGLLLNQDLDRLRRVFAPKVRGALVLDRLTRDLPLDHFILYASAAALLGAPGMGSYAAANTFLDALAHHRRALGLPALAIDWGLFSGVGMGRTADADGRAGERGLAGFTAETGRPVFHRLLQLDLPQLGAVLLDAPRWLAEVPLAARFERLADLVAEGRAAVPTVHLPGLSASLADAPLAEQPALAERFVREQVGQVLRLPPERIDPRRPLQDHGVDSVMGLELRNRLQAALGQPLPATLIWTWPTVERIGEQLVALWHAAHPPEPADVPDLGDDLLAEFDASIDDIDRMVRS
ncbi:non-ribosomal peptide synthetase/type I polyketide synthase [Nannocystis radixulma]|uniref:Amino acid adenylation domain-containing protein n=1 Tax=Nannocystis radixulma TaxID=2995305 RepID=A0ABT5B0Y6_9BACT|nr:non-ribosomal peptide synthetase/type I polyketide synthase [Nannocystis radixulma]MDC0667760.1 amino acid adenylation domain-containing protein [Nannocystis radixulma]